MEQKSKTDYPTTNDFIHIKTLLPVLCRGWLEYTAFAKVGLSVTSRFRRQLYRDLIHSLRLSVSDVSFLNDILFLYRIE